MDACRLCLAPATLQHSHYIPKALYRIVSRGFRQPVLLSAPVHLRTSRQVRAHQFCSRCEERLQQKGEDWFLANCWRSVTEFRLHDALQAARPLARISGGALYAGRAVAGVDVDQLCYFASSIFWRGSLPGWRDPIGRPIEPLQLGPYAESLRRYLAGDCGFPDGVALLTFVTTWPQDIPLCSSFAMPRFIG
ncbi:MAG TPA: hypothetical protein VMT70_12400, partial [Vicinamibacteria bacterium]|nr:hypothetical protein [Vicinamibacteria bacterium]